MRRPTIGVGHEPSLWLLFILRLRKLIKIRYLFILFFCLIILTYLRLIDHVPSSPSFHQENPVHRSDKCNFDQTESLLRYKSPKYSDNTYLNDRRPKPTVERLHKLFSILIRHEEKLRQALDYLQVFRFQDLYNTLHPFAKNTQRLHEICCMFQRYITISDNGHIDISPQLMTYLKQVSFYLSDGFTTEHPSWSKISMKDIEQPVIVLGANSRFFDNLQASMRTVNQYFPKHQVAIYDLGFAENQLNMIKENCERCVIIPFPFEKIEGVAPHIRSLPNFAWKPIVVHDAVRRYGTIIYGDTSVRYMTSDFNRIIIDNLIRGFSCRELPSHYLSCYTLSGTFSWFNESSSIYDDVYIAEAGFVAVTDNFLSRLVLKTWITCALDSECIAPSNSKSQCSRNSAPTGMHRYDQSAMVAVLSFYFYQSARQNDKTDPAPYDMFSSIQQKVAEVRRFEGDPTYFTHRHVPIKTQTNSTTTIKTP